MTLPYIKCPKCGKRSSSQNYWNCPDCSFSQNQELDLKQENKDYENEREKLIEIQEEELKQWDHEQLNLAQKIVNHLCPQEQIKVIQTNSENKESWGTSRVVKNGNKWFPSTISLPSKTLRTKEGKSIYGVLPGKTNGGGFLPTTAHESTHCSYKILHNPLYELVELLDKTDGHHFLWAELYPKFYDEAKNKFGKEVEKNFEKLEEIQKSKKN